MARTVVPTYPGLPAGGWREVNGLKTWCTERGCGLTAVLVYGGNFGPLSMGGGDGANQWNTCFASIAKTHRVVAYDKPGMGYSDAPAHDADYVMSFVVDHLIGLIESLDGGPVSLVGHSRGGYIVTRAALLRQDLVRSVTVINSGTLSPGVSTNAVALAGAPYPGESREGIRWTLEAYCNNNPLAVSEDWVDTNVQLLEAPGHQAAVRRIQESNLLLRQFYPELAREKRETIGWLREGRLQRPTQIVWGLQDQTARPELGLELFEIISAHEPRTRLDIIDNCGHFPYREHPVWFSELLQAFLDEVERDEA